MTIWFLMENQATITSVPPKIILPLGGSLDSSTPPAATLTEVRITGIGSCSATVQLLGSNDTVQQLQAPGGGGAWSNIGSALTITGTDAGVVPGVGSVSNTAPWRHYGMTMSAISGTNAAVTAKMSA